MTHLFYIFTALFIVLELLCLVESDKLDAEFKRIRKLRKEGKKAKDLYTSNVVAFSFVQTLYLSYVIIGLMSSQWVGFAVILLMSVIPKRWLLWRRIDGVISIAILIFILLNKYHFHITFI